MQVFNLDAPIEGWDAFHALDAMPPTAAVVLDNLIPGPGKVETRRGHVEFIDLNQSGHFIETVSSLNQNGVEFLLLACNGGVWFIEGDDPATLTQLSAPGTFNSSRWQHSTFRTLGEDVVLILTNGVDTPQVFDGATLTPIVDTNDVAGDGFGDGPFVGSCVFKGRVYYWKPGDDGFYYAQAGSYQGDLNRFDLGTVVLRGGELIDVKSWTRQDSGDGKDDFIVYIFSTGEILVYQGDDPQDLAYWELIGRFYTSEPMSYRGTEHYGADLIVMTRDGYMNLGQVMQQGRTVDISQFSMMIHNAITSRTEDSKNRYGWQAKLVPADGLFIFNVPLSGNRFEQHVLNTATMRWCRFTDLNVICMELHSDELYGGAVDGRLYKLLNSAADRGEPIQFTCLTAYQTFGDGGNQNHLTAAQILSTHEQPQKIKIQAYSDYEFPAITRLPAEDFNPNEGVWSDPPPPGSVKGSGWADSPQTDKGSFWSSGLTPVTTKGWQNVSAYGFAVALLVQFARVNSGVVWRNTGLRIHQGGSQ